MKAISTLIFTLTSLFFHTYICANDIETNAGEIVGIIVDKNTSEPIPYASVALINAGDSSIVTGVISLEDGTFRMESVPYGTYKVKATFVGYAPVTIDNVVVSRKNRKIDLKTLIMDEDITKLEGAEIVQERLKGEEKIDRTVFTLNDQIRNTSSSGIDMLKHIPSVSVDFQDNVQLEGNSNIQFYVDGILRNKDFVSQLDPKSIDKVELITNPGVKYSADIAGVINIVLKKEKRYGVSGSVLAPVFRPDMILANPRANVEYGNQNFRVYVGDRLHYEGFDGKEYNKTILDESISDSPYTFEKKTTGKNAWQNNYMNAGIDWFVTDKTTLNLLGEWRKFKGVSKDFFSTNSIYQQGDLTSYYETDRESEDNNDNYYLSLFLKHKFNEEGSELTAEIYTYQSASVSEFEYFDTYFQIPELNTITDEVIRNEYTDNSIQTIELKLDYSFVTENIKHEFGVREYKQWMDNQFVKSGSLEVVTGEVTDKFEYDEFRQVAYYNASGKVESLTWQAGIRGEYSDINIQDSSSTDYFVFLPQFSAGYKIGEGKNLKITYRRQIRRPSANNLNPFVTYYDSLHLKRGNPDLKPSYEHKFELSYSQNFGSNYISPKFYVSFVNDGIQEFSTIDDEGIETTSQANIGENIEYGVNLNAAIQITEKWKVNGNFSVFERRIDEAPGSSIEENNRKVSYRANLNTVYSLPKDFNVFAFGQYGSPNIAYQREYSRDLLVLCGVSKNIKENWQVEAYYNPFIKTFMYNKAVTETPGYYSEWYGELNIHHIFGIEITYKFNYGGKIKKLKRDADYEKNESGGGI